MSQSFSRTCQRKHFAASFPYMYTRISRRRSDGLTFPSGFRRRTIFATCAGKSKAARDRSEETRSFSRSRSRVKFRVEMRKKSHSRFALFNRRVAISSCIFYGGFSMILQKWTNISRLFPTAYFTQHARRVLLRKKSLNEARKWIFRVAFKPDVGSD